MAKVLCVLYDDPISGYPSRYVRNDIPKIEKYPDGQTVPNPKHIDFVPEERIIVVRTGSVCRRDTGNSRVLVREAADPRRIPNHVEREARRHWGEILRRR